MIVGMTPDQWPLAMGFLSECFHREAFTSRGHRFPTAEGLERLFQFADRSDDVWLRVLLESGMVVGVAAVIVFPSLLNPAQKRTTEVVWHPAPGRMDVMLTLLREMEAFAASRSVALVIQTDEAHPVMGRILERHGFQPWERVYGKVFDGH